MRDTIKGIFLCQARPSIEGLGLAAGIIDDGL